VRHPVVIMGGGPIGLGHALDLGLQGIPVVVLDDHEGIGMGARDLLRQAPARDRRPLRLRHTPMVDKGVKWNLGKVFHDDRKVYEFNLLPEDGHSFPPSSISSSPISRNSWSSGSARHRPRARRSSSARQQPRRCRRGHPRPRPCSTSPRRRGLHELEADWLIGLRRRQFAAARMLDLDFEGKVFEDSFLIADITDGRRSSRPSAGSGSSRLQGFAAQSALLHKQPDGVWRIDFQIGWDVDRAEELKAGKRRRRLDAMLGPDVEYELVWTSIYTFQCRRMKKFRHGRVIFAGDAAHQVSPFGARGANSGMQDVDNLGWKLGLMIDGQAPERLLDSYDEERIHGADENILNSTRATDFITPKSRSAGSSAMRCLILPKHQLRPAAGEFRAAFRALHL
jgi:3-(3-hydroxy-phenyl)propionate hydroxylase